MSSIYFITFRNLVFNTRIKSRTCLIGIPEKPAATRVKRSLEMSHGLTELKVSEVDYMRDEFYEMLKLNQFTLMVANYIDFSDDSLEIRGDVLDSPRVTHDELATHLEKIYVQDGPRY
jgi:hypothetical protein